MIRPIITYGCIAWWPVINTQTAINLCTKMQRLGCLLISGCIRSCPTIPMQAIIGLTPLHLFILKVAAKTAIRFGCVGHFAISTESPHTMITTLIPQWELISTYSDFITPRLDFGRYFDTIIPTRESYTDLNSLSPDDPNVWYTDGSKTDEGSGSGIYNCNEEISVSLGPTASVFQAELHAISVCAANLLQRRLTGQHVRIYSDSQAGIKALANPRCNSQTVLDCKHNLNQLGLHNTITIYWIPGHSNHRGNEEADRLANVGSATHFDDPTPVLKLGAFYAENKIDEWIHQLEDDLWDKQTGLRLSKRLINVDLHCKAINCNRSSIRQFIGYLTGHHVTRDYLFKIGRGTDQGCRICESDIETTEHLLLNCPGLDYIRFIVLGSHKLTDRDIRSAQCKDLVRFINRVEKRLNAHS